MKAPIRAWYACAAVAALAGTAAGDVIEWANPVSGIFSEPANWTGGLVPGVGDFALFGGTDAYVISLPDGKTSIQGVLLDNPQSVLVVGLGQTLSLANGAGRLAGEIHVNPDGLVGPEPARIESTSGPYLSGPGAIVLGGGSAELDINSLRLQQGFLRGAGLVRARSLTLSGGQGGGPSSLEVLGGTLDLLPPPVRRLGLEVETAHIAPGSTLRLIRTDVSYAGSIVVDAGELVIGDASLVDVDFIELLNDAVIRFDAGAGAAPGAPKSFPRLRVRSFDGRVEVEPGTFGWLDLSTLIATPTIEVGVAGAELASIYGELMGSQVRLLGADTSALGGNSWETHLRAGARVTGSGRILDRTVFFDDAVLSPGDDANPYGEIILDATDTTHTLPGKIAFDYRSVFEIDIGGTDPEMHDRIVGIGQRPRYQSLGSTITWDIRLGEGFEPQPGDRAKILDLSAGVDPALGWAAPPTIQAPDVSPLVVRLLFAPNDSVIVAFACPADWNADGFTNDSDFFDFVNDFFSESGPQGQFDFNRDGFENDQDFFDFTGAFFTPGGGC